MVPTLPLAPIIAKDLDDLVRSEFEAFRNSWFNWLLIWTAIVAVGLLFELPEIWHETVDAVRVLRGKLKGPEIAPWLKLPVSVGWLLIVVGVSGEFVADSFVSKADGIVQTFDEILMADAQRQTELAKIRAGGAYERATENEKEAAQLRKDAEAEHLARVKIEAAVGWRSLSDQQKRDIGAALASFSPKAGASIWFNASSTEAEMFADDIGEALRFGHITTTAPGGMMEMAESGKWNAPIKPAETGVRIQCTKYPSACEFADALITELTNRGFDAHRQTDPPFDDKVQAPVIWVNVEPRPKGPQGEYKLQAEHEANARNKTKSRP